MSEATNPGGHLAEPEIHDHDGLGPHTHEEPVPVQRIIDWFTDNGLIVSLRVRVDDEPPTIDQATLFASEEDLLNGFAIARWRAEPEVLPS